jgi:hypothetical protein
MPDSERDNRIKYYRDQAVGLINFIDDPFMTAIKSYFNENKDRILEETPEQSLFHFLIRFLRRQKDHLKSVLILEKENAMDTMLIVRSMLEGVAQLRFVRNSEKPIDLAIQWSRFNSETERGYWYKTSMSSLIKILGENLEELLSHKGTLDSGLLLEYYRAFSAYHHWNLWTDFEKMGGPNELSLAFSCICARYAIETVNDLLKLGLEEKLKQFRSI